MRIRGCMAVLLMGGIGLSCSEDEYIVTLVPVSSISTLAKTGTGIHFAVKALGGSSCTGFSHFDVTTEESVRSIRIFSKRNKEDVCAAVITEFDAAGSIDISGGGTYTLRFWQTDTTSLDSIIVFP
jgi:hypothetical protein